MSRIGGWWRLWIAGSGLLLLVTGIATFGKRDLTGDGAGSTSCIPGTTQVGARIETTWIDNPKYYGMVGRQRTLGEAVDDSAAWAALLKSKGLTSSDEHALPVTKAIQTFSCASWGNLGSYLAFAALIAFSVALGGVLFRWILRGFKK